MKVLVVDDDRRIVKTTCDILKIKGHEPLAAYTGEEALEKVNSAAPDCVLMDIKMPGINGVEAMKRMKEAVPALPIILVTAYATEELMADARENGAYAVLSKPLNFQMILSFLSLLSKEESILVVDDDPNFCRTLKDVLAMRGFWVETESRPEQVMNHLDEKYRLVVVLDLKLGKVNGTDVLKEIRTKYPTKPVVLMTGYRDEMAASIEKGRKIGAYTCLYKPFEMDALLRVIDEIRVRKLQSLLAMV